MDNVFTRIKRQVKISSNIFAFLTVIFSPYTLRAPESFVVTQLYVKL